MSIDFETLVREAETADREVFEARADEERTWLDEGGIDILAAHYGAADPTDDFLF